MRKWILCFLLATTPALADDTAKAKQLYDEGLRHYNVAEYPQAIESWKQAYLISKKPLLLFNIGQAYRLSGDCKQATTFYDNYQNAEPAPKNQDELDQAIAACKAATPTKPVETPPVVTTTKPPIDTQPTPAPTKPIEPVVTPPVETTMVSSGRGRTIGMIVGLTGVVLEGGAIVFALQGRSKALDAEKVSTWDQHAMDLQSAGERDNKLAWAFGIVGGAAIATGVVLYVTGGASGEHGVAIAPTRGGAQVGWSHSF